MSLFSKFLKTNKELESLAAAVSNNAANNYKDAAQEAFRIFSNRYDELKEDGSLNEKQQAHYEKIKEEFEKELQGFHH